MVVGEYFADIIVEDLIIVELKAISELAASHEVQLINYLKATKKKVGLLINFGDKITIRRKIMDKKMKK
jgi:GxxExxY protein